MSDYNDGILPEPCLRMDTHFGDEYESVEFGDGTGYIKAAPILAKVGALHEEIDRLRDENAKLRELVRDMWEGYNDPRCEDCPLKDKPACADCPICAREAAVIDRMRELGVEV